MKLYTQDPTANLDHSEDWEEWLGADTISTSTWSISPSGPTLSGDSKTDTTTTVYVEGITLGTVYTLRNAIVTAGSREDVRSRQIIGEAL